MSFENERDKLIKTTHWNGPLQCDGFSIGANWAYKFMCDKNFQFALHRQWVSKAEKLTAELQAEKEKTEKRYQEIQVRNEKIEMLERVYKEEKEKSKMLVEALEYIATNEAFLDDITYCCYAEKALLFRS